MANPSHEPDFPPSAPAETPETPESREARSSFEKLREAVFRNGEFARQWDRELRVTRDALILNPNPDLQSFAFQRWTEGKPARLAEITLAYDPKTRKFFAASKDSVRNEAGETVSVSEGVDLELPTEVSAGEFLRLLREIERQVEEVVQRRHQDDRSDVVGAASNQLALLQQEVETSA